MKKLNQFYISKLFVGLLLILIPFTVFPAIYNIKSVHDSISLDDSCFYLNNCSSGSTESNFMTQDQIPTSIHDALMENGINHLQFVSYETVVVSMSNKLIYHKLILTSTSKIHVLYFDQDGQIIKERKWSKGVNSISI